MNWANVAVCLEIDSVRKQTLLMKLFTLVKTYKVMEVCAPCLVLKRSSTSSLSLLAGELDIALATLPKF